MRLDQICHQYFHYPTRKLLWTVYTSSDISYLSNDKTFQCVFQSSSLCAFYMIEYLILVTPFMTWHVNAHNCLFKISHVIFIRINTISMQNLGSYQGVSVVCGLNVLRNQCLEKSHLFNLVLTNSLRDWTCGQLGEKPVH